MTKLEEIARAIGDARCEDNHRFINDLEQWYGKPIVRLRSSQYATIDDVFEHRKYLSGSFGIVASMYVHKRFIATPRPTAAHDEGGVHHG